MSQRQSVKNFKIDSPLGKNSVFHNVYDDPEGVTYPNDSTGDEDKYTYTIYPCESGVEVFDKYNSTSYQPKSRQILIFVEQKDTTKNNFFGTACRVKMGEERREFMWKLFDKQTLVSINDDQNLARNLNEWAEDIAYHSKNKKTEIDKNVLLNAVKLELSNKTDANKIFQTLFGLNDNLAVWIRSGIEVMDGWNFKEENYEFAKYGKELKPIIPVNFFTPSKDYLFTGKKDKTVLKDNGIHNLLQLSDKLDEVIFNKAYVLALATPWKSDDVLFATVWFIKEFLVKSLPEGIKKIFEKVKAIVNQAKDFIKKIGKELQKVVALYNAFLCGLANGLISLLQMVVWAVAFVIDNIPFLEQENFSKEKLAEHQQKLEFIEDLVDTIDFNLKELFEGFLASFKTIGTEIATFVKEVGKKIANLSQYWWAFIIVQ